MALLRPCATTAGFTANPERTRRVDLACLGGRLAADGYLVVVDARVLLIVRKEVESTVHQNGRVLLKTTDRVAAEAAYAGLRPHLEACWA